MADFETIPSHYIVTLKPNIAQGVVNDHVDRIQRAFSQRSAITGDTYSVGVKHRYKIHDFVGYSGSFDDETLAEIKGSLEVLQIEPDTYVETQDDQVHIQQNVPSWGLARICRDRRVDEHTTTYVYPAENGQGTYAHVIDSGIYIEHDEFNNGGVRRARWGCTIVSTAESTKNTDTNGHGTHVAGTIAGFTCGVAKQAQVIAVKVFRDATEEEKKEHKKVGARISDIIKGIEWSVDDADQNIHKSIVNMSLGGRKSLAFNRAVKGAVDQGMTVVVASGNQETDTSTRSPASAPEAIAVGATDIQDKNRKTSNYGKFVDLLAPGDKITSAGIETKSQLVQKSGTSMASPHVAGVGCCLLTDTTGAVSVIQLLKKMAGRNELTLENQKDTLNLTLNNGVHVQ